MLLWVAPGFRENKVVVATLPRGTQNIEGRLLKELVTSLQIHSCVESRCKGELLGQCKYGFPYEMRPTDGLDRLVIWDEYAQTQKENERIVSLITIWEDYIYLALVIILNFKMIFSYPLFSGLVQGGFAHGNDLLMSMLLLQRKMMGHDKLYQFLCSVLSWGLMPTHTVFELASNQEG